MIVKEYFSISNQVHFVCFFQTIAGTLHANICQLSLVTKHMCISQPLNMSHTLHARSTCASTAKVGHQAAKEMVASQGHAAMEREWQQLRSLLKSQSTSFRFGTYLKISVSIRPQHDSRSNCSFMSSGHLEGKKWCTFFGGSINHLSIPKSCHDMHDNE